uniref:Uncharacterized protein n=1 Tax=Acrobeloides nanus TaxID=290746 RepID=A0A914CJS3_9BILA
MEEKQFNFLIVPPPPTELLKKYREVIKFLVNEETEKIVRLTEDGDAFGAIGRNGNRIHLDEVKKEGGWTERGLNRTRNVLVETLGFKFVELRLAGKDPFKIHCQPQLRPVQDLLRNTLITAPKGRDLSLWSFVSLEKIPFKIHCQPQLRPVQDLLRNTLITAPKGRSQVIVPTTPLFRNVIPQLSTWPLNRSLVLFIL